jgi:hypothetical protein
MRNFKQLSPGEFGGAYDGQIMWLPQQPGYTISDLLGNELKHADIKNIGDLEPLHHELWLTEAGTLMTLGRI